MIKYILLYVYLIFISACSSNNSVVKNPITGEKKNLVYFLKTQKKE